MASVAVFRSATGILLIALVNAVSPPIPEDPDIQEGHVLTIHRADETWGLPARPVSGILSDIESPNTQR